MNEKRPAYPKGTYTSGAVRLYGLIIEPDGDSINFSGLVVKGVSAESAPSFHQRTTGTTVTKRPELNPGLIFAYAYQGHCYDLDKPKVMLLPTSPVQLSADECGFPGGGDYHVWVVDRLEPCLAVDVSEGRVEELVLEANKPGRRSPPTYRGEMQIAHRSGRLTE